MARVRAEVLCFVRSSRAVLVALQLLIEGTPTVLGTGFAPEGVDEMRIGCVEPKASVCSG